MNKLISNLRKLNDLLFPEICPLCGRPVEPGRRGVFCHHCTVKWESAKAAARMDHFGAIPSLEFESDNERFGKAAFLAFYEHDDYDSAVDTLIFKLKQSPTSAVTNFVAEEYIGMLRTILPEIFEPCMRENIIVTWIPRRPESVKTYGFDHMKLVCESFASKCGYECEQLIFRRHGSAEQKSLGSHKRLENVEKNLYSANKDLSGKTIILLDDLITTGSSMKVGCELLCGNGAKMILSASLLCAKR